VECIQTQRQTDEAEYIISPRLAAGDSERISLIVHAAVKIANFVFIAGITSAVHRL